MCFSHFQTFHFTVNGSKQTRHIDLFVRMFRSDVVITANSTSFSVRSGDEAPCPDGLRVHWEFWWGESKNQTVSLMFSSRFHYHQKELLWVSRVRFSVYPHTHVLIHKVVRFFFFFLPSHWQNRCLTLIVFGPPGLLDNQRSWPWMCYDPGGSPRWYKSNFTTHAGMWESCQDYFRLPAGRSPKGVSDPIQRKWFVPKVAGRCFKTPNNSVKLSASRVRSLVC